MAEAQEKPRGPDLTQGIPVENISDGESGQDVP